MVIGFAPVYEDRRSFLGGTGFIFGGLFLEQFAQVRIIAHASRYGVQGLRHTQADFRIDYHVVDSIYAEVMR